MRISFQATCQILRSLYPKHVVEISNGIAHDHLVFISVIDKKVKNNDKGFCLYDFRYQEATALPKQWTKAFEDAYVASSSNYERMDELAEQDRVNNDIITLVEQDEEWEER